MDATISSLVATIEADEGIDRRLAAARTLAAARDAGVVGPLLELFLRLRDDGRKELTLWALHEVVERLGSRVPAAELQRIAALSPAELPESIYHPNALRQTMMDEDRFAVRISEVKALARKLLRRVE